MGRRCATGIWFGCVERDGYGNCTRYNAPDIHNNSIFEDRILAFRQWMSAKGERDKPLWITEYESLFPYYYTPIEETARFLTENFDFLLGALDTEVGYPYDGNKLVQRWLLYSLKDEVDDFGGSLYDPNNSATIAEVGTPWVNYGYI